MYQVAIEFIAAIPVFWSGTFDEDEADYARKMYAEACACMAADQLRKVLLLKDGVVVAQASSYVN